MLFGNMHRDFFVNSTSVSVCRNKRIPRHKVFDGIAQREKSTMDYFFGFKLHYVVNDRGEILIFVITLAISMIVSP